MYLKSLEIQGFKSFPDKTLLKFNDGITAIVGPNGSGKSNISDAIRWVLGEQSTKTLRGNKMEDVIFDGTQDRKGLGFAEVSLTLDNTDGTLPLEYNEVTVTRRYYRSGESEYMINKTVVRLKDIHELFMDTGLGRDGYSLIGQGRIAEVLSVKSDERRQIFEEAAGISKFRYRKLESEKKLSATEENLIRIKDILTELEDRVEPLREQAEKARKYLDLREERKGLEVSLWLDTIDKIVSGKTKLEEDYNNVKDELERAERIITDDERLIDDTYEKINEKSAQIDKAREEIRHFEEQAQQKEADAALVQNDIAHNEEIIQRIKNEIQEDINRIKSYDEQIAERKAEIDNITVSISMLNNELEALTTESEDIIKQTSEAYGKMDALKSETLKLTGEITDLKIKSSSMESSISAANENLERIKTDKENRTNELIEASDNLAELKKTIEEKLERKQSFGNIINGYELRVKTATDKLTKLTDEKTAASNALADKNFRINALKDMESHFEGFAASVKSVMQGASRGALQGIHGPVSSLIKVSDEYATAVETALGGNIQNIVTDTEEQAKAAIYYLKSSNAGRATFLPVSSVKGEIIVDNTVKTHTGFIGIASELVTADSIYSGIIKSLLGRTAVFENMDNAIALAKKTGYKFRLVTLDGQLINPGGSLTGGSAAKNSGILTRSNQIERLTAEAEQIKEKLKQIETTHKEQEAKLSKDRAYLDGVKAELRTLEEELIKDNSNLEHSNILVNGLKGAIEQYDLEADKLNKATETLKIEYNQIAEKLTELEKQANELEEEYNRLSDGHGNLAQLREKLTSDITEKKLAILEKQKDIDLQKASIAELEAGKKERAAQTGTKEQEITLLSEKNTALADIIKQANAEAVSLKEKAKEIQTGIAGMISEREGLEKSVGELRTRVKERQGDKDRLIREVERLEGKRENVSAEYDSLIAKLWDEYELTYTQATEMRTELESVAKAQKRINEIKASMKKLGDVNIGSIEEYKQVKERYEFLSGQTADLIKAKADLENIINDLTEQMKSIFAEQFKVINSNFDMTFKELFDGGKAELIMSDPSDILNSGIEIKVTPPGKIIKNLSALSGGEQSFVAIALYFAILKVRPTPFCVLDEIEAALDDVNVTRYAEYLRKLTCSTQFIVITHRRGTMEEADILYGVTMQEKGVSKLLTINVNEVVEKLNITAK